MHLSNSLAVKCSRNVPVTPHTTKWCFWVVDNHQKQKRRVKLWLILASIALVNDEKMFKKGWG